VEALYKLGEPRWTGGIASENVDDPARWTGAIDLLPLVDPKVDRVQHGWELRNGRLSSADKAWAKLALPFRPGAEYDLRVVVSHTSDAGYVISQLLPHGSDGVVFELRYHNGWGFFPCAKGKNFGPVTLEAVKTHVSVLQVRKDSVRAFIDGQLVLDTRPPFSEGAIPGVWSFPDRRQIGVGSRTATEFHEIQLLEISGRGEFTRPDDPAAKEAEKKRRPPATP
jgi:hypothetical protein